MSSTALLRSTLFRREREPTWERLEQLVQRVERRGLGALEPRELAELPAVYRATMSSLGMARAISLDRNLLEHLDSLAQRAWCAFYAPSRSWRDRLREWLMVGFPASVRALGLPLFVATLTLLGGIAIGHAMTTADEEMYHAFVPEAYAQGRNPSTPRSELWDGLYGIEDHHGALAMFASHLIVNNTGVGLLLVALGFLAGLPALILLFFNALLLGAMSALFARHGLALDFWAWVLPHGVTELLAILLCGAASLAIGGALVAPGTLGRRQALAGAGRRAAPVVMGAMAMFGIAGLIEGFFRQLVTDTPTRVALALLTAVLWAAWLGLGGRLARARA
ncbi:MAG: stage II sporulation protein M [Planctomycetota bacterium]